MTKIDSSIVSPTTRIAPRNSLVLLRLHEKDEAKVGQIIVKSQNSEYCRATVVNVGPGTIQAEGGRSETFDLQPGQVVLVKRQTQMTGPDGSIRGYRREGLEIANGDETLYVFEQSSILAIVEDPRH